MTTQRKEFPEGAVLVIGGSGGAGEAICGRFAELGSDVVLTYHRNEARAAQVVAAVQAKGQRAQAWQLSMSDLDGVRRTLAAILAQGRIHTVVIAAGSDIAQPPIRDLDVAQWRAVIDADLNGFFAIVQATLPHLKAQGGGSYVHVSSAGMHRWPEGDVLSVAPKAAIDSLLQGIAKEEGRFGVRANSVAIGVIETGIFLRLWQDGTFDDKWRDAVQRNLCLKRWGQASEVADAVAFLASNRALYTTGQVLSVDGGYGV
ncbi:MULTISPECIES: SDR family NAD(P)-dependent oxidoreductase [Pseudomonas]|uniref:3-oxoacyl-[acyl-carrier-protein] reductase FabG n=1 Tax=Pseudomonas putida TaxID=303 RepID=A0A1B2F6F3_PSEPU|nr:MULTISPECIES: SDR family oxidoreductase [Pseudomonas]ANY87780.1 3-oxoacyl-[acyl-carrier-protein] reductase FabG [Pseudomonas putida]MCL8304782.1 SDR family oxidoreductase [Pseudomonas putida]